MRRAILLSTSVIGVAALAACLEQYEAAQPPSPEPEAVTELPASSAPAQRALLKALPPKSAAAPNEAPKKARAKARRAKAQDVGVLGTRGPRDNSALHGLIGANSSLDELAAVDGDGFEARGDSRVNGWNLSGVDNLSTFAVDVDTAAYAIARRTLRAGGRPQPSLVRAEELINYFSYDYDAPSSRPFSIHIDGSRSPVDPDVHLMRVGLQSQVVSNADREPVNLVFLVDTSCSMTSSDKLGLVKDSLRIATSQLRADDHVAITTYAGGVSLVLRPTRGADKADIRAAIERLETAGGTAMESGMILAYRQAAQMHRAGTNTRVIVCSDGDANIGATHHADMLAKIASHVDEGVRMSTIGYGDGNYKDMTMEQLANKGNGNYFYIDSLAQAERVFARDFTKMVQDVAQDVKIQVEFDPSKVRSYRLVGYENRDVADRDFRNDEVDAGEIGAGHQVTALYELRLAPQATGTLGAVRVRSKRPGGKHASEVARRIESTRVDRAFESAASDLRFAVAVMAGAEIMRRSPHARGWNLDRVVSIAEDAGHDADRREFVALMRKAKKNGVGGRYRR